jgi:hypothetical protein
MTIMRVPVVELLYQTTMGQLLVLKYLLLGECGCLFPSLVVPGIKCHHFLRMHLCWCSSDTKSPRVWFLGDRVCPELGR